MTKFEVTLAFVACTFVVVAASCGMTVGDEKALATAEKAGFTNSKILARHDLAPSLMGGCDSHDAIGFDMRGTNPAGKTLEFKVCCGAVVKGCTVRY